MRVDHGRMMLGDEDKGYNPGYSFHGRMLALAQVEGMMAVVGDNARAAVAAMNDGDVILLENTRFRPEETKNGEAFSKDLASIADVFVNDAFGTAHRAHCSNVGVTQYVDTAVVGYLMQKEIDFLGNAVNNPVRPFVAILGGSKVSSKISVINNLLDKVDTLIIGGAYGWGWRTNIHSCCRINCEN